MSDRRARVLVALLGLLLLAAGAAGAAGSLDAFGGAGERVLPGALTAGFRDAAPWSALGLALVGVLLGLLGLRLVLALARTDRLGEVELERERSAGGTVLTAGAVQRAVERDAEGVRGVRSARAVLRGARSGPVLALRVVLEDRVDLAAVRTDLEQGTVLRARTTLDLPELPVELELRVPATTRRPVL